MKFFLLLAVFVAGCSTGIPVEKFNAPVTTPESFSLCHGYGCKSKTKTGFSKAEWKKITAVFPAKNADVERSKIARAIAMMEKFTGDKTGLSQDRGEADKIKTDDHQLDCVDETVNTTQYLHILAAKGLLKYHAPAKPLHRGYFLDGRWPHNTAAMREVKGDKLFVVDSYYRGNGGAPYIIPAHDWLSGWRPSDTKP